MYSRAGYHGVHTVVNFGKIRWWICLESEICGYNVETHLLQKETYLIQKEKLLISKNLVIRKRKAFDLK